MALTQCPECMKDVSDQAVNCPQCGYPIKKEVLKRRREKLQFGTIEKIKAYIIVAVPLFILGSIWLYVIVRYFPEATLSNLSLTIPTIVAGVLFIVGAVGLVLAIISLSEVAVLWVWNKIFK